MRIQNSYFKGNDRVENFLADEVRSGRMSLGKHGIASDWTQYLPAANRYVRAADPAEKRSSVCGEQISFGDGRLAVSFR